MPLVAASDAAYGWARTPDGKAAVATTGEGGELIAIVIDRFPVMPLLSVTVKTGVDDVSVDDGVPVSPPEGERVIQEESPVALQTYGGVPPVADRVAEYG